jgi:hypothetical protein
MQGIRFVQLFDAVLQAAQGDLAKLGASLTVDLAYPSFLSSLCLEHAANAAMGAANPRCQPSALSPFKWRD